LTLNTTKTLQGIIFQHRFILLETNNRVQGSCSGNQTLPIACARRSAWLKEASLLIFRASGRAMAKILAGELASYFIPVAGYGSCPFFLVYGCDLFPNTVAILDGVFHQFLLF